MWYIEDRVDGLAVDDESQGVLGMLTTGGKSMSILTQVTQGSKERHAR